jgi:hypothetical protein
VPDIGSHANAVGGKCLRQHEGRARGARDPKDPVFANLETRGVDPKLPASCPASDEGGVRIRLCDSGAGRAQSLKSIRPRQWRRILATNGKDA